MPATGPFPHFVSRGEGGEMHDFVGNLEELNARHRHMIEQFKEEISEIQNRR